MLTPNFCAYLEWTGYSSARVRTILWVALFSSISPRLSVALYKLIVRGWGPLTSFFSSLCMFIHRHLFTFSLGKYLSSLPLPTLLNLSFLIIFQTSFYYLLNHFAIRFPILGWIYPPGKVILVNKFLKKIKSQVSTKYKMNMCQSFYLIH